MAASLRSAPIFTIAFLIVTFSSIAVPVTNGFIGEFLILLGGFGANKLAHDLCGVGRDSWGRLHALDGQARVLWAERAR